MPAYPFFPPAMVNKQKGQKGTTPYRAMRENEPPAAKKKPNHRTPTRFFHRFAIRFFEPEEAVALF